MNLNGVLLLNKPRGMTSHDCVMKLRRILKTKKIGHTGTLDPDVDGVLPICIGSATKIVQFLTAEQKTYLGEVTIGYSTTTEDKSGDLVERLAVTKPLSKEAIESVLTQMVGTTTQTPPMYSAVKVNGKKLYEYARAGLSVERPTREVTIYELDMLGVPEHTEDCMIFKFKVRGSKGIFIRTVAVTIGEKLGYPAHMSDLTRVASGQFELENCVTFDDIETGRFNLLTINEALSNFSTVVVDNWVEKLVRNGVKLREEQIQPVMKNGQFLIKSNDGMPLSIHEWSEEKEGYVSVRGLW